MFKHKEDDSRWDSTQNITEKICPTDFVGWTYGGIFSKDMKAEEISPEEAKKQACSVWSKTPPSQQHHKLAAALKRKQVDDGEGRDGEEEECEQIQGGENLGGEEDEGLGEDGWLCQHSGNPCIAFAGQIFEMERQVMWTAFSIVAAIVLASAAKKTGT